MDWVYAIVIIVVVLGVCIGIRRLDKE